MKGFLPTAIEDADVGGRADERADLEGRINDFILYGGYVLSALDPGAETQASVQDGVRAAADHLSEDRDPRLGLRRQEGGRGRSAACSSRGEIRGRVR